MDACAEERPDPEGSDSPEKPRRRPIRGRARRVAVLVTVIVAAASPVRGDFMGDVRTALRRDFARFLDDHALGLGAGARGLKELGADDGELDIFLWSVVRHGPPGRAAQSNRI